MVASFALHWAYSSICDWLFTLYINIFKEITMSRKLLDFVRSRTENGIFLRIRSLFLYVGFFVVNFPVSAARNKSSRNLNKLKNSTVVIVSIYRPIFWFGNLLKILMVMKTIIILLKWVLTQFSCI